MPFPLTIQYIHPANYWDALHNVAVTGTPPGPLSITEDGTTNDHWAGLFASPVTPGVYKIEVDYKGIGPTPRRLTVAINEGDVWDEGLEFYWSTTGVLTTYNNWATNTRLSSTQPLPATSSGPDVNGYYHLTMYVEFLQDVHLPSVILILSDGSGVEPTYLGLNNGSGIGVNNLSWQNIPTVRLRRSLTAGNVPSSLAAGELAQNVADELLFFRSPSGVVTPLKLPDCERLISAGQVTNSASVTLGIDPAVVGIFRAFRLHITDWRPSSAGNALRMRMGDSGGLDLGSSDYKWGWLYTSEANGGFFSTDLDTGDSEIEFTYTSDTTTSLSMNGTVWFGTNDPAAVVQNHVFWDFATVYNFSGSFEMHMMGYGHRVAHIDLTQIQLAHISGNIATGKYELIGIL